MPQSSDQLVQALLMKKSGQALAFLAAECLGVPVGERIPTFTEFAQGSPFSRGTLQNAMGGLEKIGAMKLIRRGHLGTFVAEKDTRLLMQCCGVNYISGTMPLPYTKKYEGLATGLFENFQQRDIAIDIAYMRGSQKRIQSVVDGRYDFAIASRLSALGALQQGLAVDIARDFGPGSYLTGQSIVFRDPACSEITTGMRIGMDTTSLDHVRLTRRATEGVEVTTIPVSYNQIITMLLDDKIDAAVWNIDNILETGTSLNYSRLDCPDNDENTAVLLVAKTNPAMAAVIHEYMDIKAILDCQKKVVAGEVYPNY